MKVVNLSDVVNRKSDSAHRGGNIGFATLLNGKEGSLDNYWLVLAQTEGTRYSPRHRHNFDQFRFSVAGDLSIGTRKWVREGEVGYFPEGTHYGPQDDGGNPRTSLVLQFAGASGQGFVSQRQSLQAQQELKEFGRFEGGVFYRERGEGKKNQDGFEALWEHINKRKLEYPPRRYQEPIILDPTAFAWRATQQSGVMRKMLGVFSERETRLELFQLEPHNTWHVHSEHATRIGFIVEGDGVCDGKSFTTHAALEGAPGDSFQITASTSITILVMTIPSYEPRKMAYAAE
jgi:hypothetical protein